MSSRTAIFRVQAGSMWCRPFRCIFPTTWIPEVIMMLQRLLGSPLQAAQPEREVLIDGWICRIDVA